MENMFISFLNRNISITYLIVVIILARYLLRNAQKKILCILWILVGIRMLVPVSFQSILSVIPRATTIPRTIFHQSANTITNINGTGTGSTHIVTHPVTTIPSKVNLPSSLNNEQIVIYVLITIWIVGVLGLLCYGMITILSLKRRIATAIPLRENIYQCDMISSPFVMRMLTPRIYIPFTLEENSLPYVINHEKVHIRRRDHLIKPLGFLLLSFYWFNPFVWAAYLLLCRDIELACDEKVIDEIGTHEKKAYSSTLLACSTRNRRYMLHPLSFGEVGVKNRIKNILNYKKPSSWITLIAILTVIIICICFMSDPQNKDQNKSNPNSSTGKLTGTPSQTPQTAPTTTVEPTLTAVEPTLTTVPMTPTPQPTPMMNKDGFFIYDQSKENINVLYADINRDGEDETINLDLSTYDNAQPAFLKIYCKDRKLIWKEQLFSAQSDQNSYYLCEQNGAAYILQYNPYSSQGSCTYSFELFYLNKYNQKVIKKKDFINFDTYPLGEKINFDVTALYGFYQEINAYLNNSILLISTLEGNLEYSTDTDLKTKLEDYDFLNSDNPGLVYSDKDEIKEKLKKFYQYLFDLKK